jgi:hypothetical protein
MKGFTQSNDYQFKIRWLSGCLLWLLCLPQTLTAQTRQRPVEPITDPTQACASAYSQRTGATYVAANHLSGSFGVADIGTTGVNTTIDIGL